MRTLTSLPEPAAERELGANSLRKRALERLYHRRNAIDHLIDALERYRNDTCSEGSAAVLVSAVSK